MDAIDRDILRSLQEKGRMTNLELAKAVGLSPTPTRRRVRELERTGAILGYRALVDPGAVERSFHVLVSVDLVQGTRETIEAFEQALLDIPRRGRGPTAVRRARLPAAGRGAGQQRVRAAVHQPASPRCRGSARPGRRSP